MFYEISTSTGGARQFGPAGFLDLVQFHSFKFELEGGFIVSGKAVNRRRLQWISAEAAEVSSVL